MEEQYLTPKQVAALLQIKPATLAAHRSANRGVPYVKIGNIVRYRKADVDNYMSTGKRATCRDANRMARIRAFVTKNHGARIQSTSRKNGLIYYDAEGETFCVKTLHQGDAELDGATVSEVRDLIYDVF